MINSKYRYYFFATGLCIFLAMQFQIFLKYQEIYGKTGARFSLVNFLSSVSVLAIFLSILSCLFFWLGNKSDLTEIPVPVKN